jgi:hypothetical protein
MDNLEHKVDNLDKKVSEIYNAIMGTQFHEKGGYKPRLEDLEGRVETIEDMITKWKWILVGAIGLGGYGGLTFIQQLIEVIGKSIK